MRTAELCARFDMGLDFFKRKRKVESPKEVRPETEYKTYGNLEQPGYTWRLTHLEEGDTEGIRYTEKDKEFATDRVHSAFAAFGRNIDIDWGKITLREIRRTRFYDPRFQDGLMQHMGGKLLIMVPHKVDNQGDFTTSVKEARLTLSHELMHAVGVSLLTEGETDGELRRSVRSGLHQVSSVEHEEDRPDLRHYGQMLNEAFVSTLNDDRSYPFPRRIFKKVVEKITKRERSRNPQWREKDTMKLFADSYLDGWQPELMDKIIDAYGVLGFKALMSLQSFDFGNEKDYYRFYGDNPLEIFMESEGVPSEAMAQAILAHSSPEARKANQRMIM